jgi:hypothetical protein
MRDPSRSGWSWRFAAGLVLIAALAQACGGSSSQSTGAQTGRAEFRFSQVKGTRLGALPQECTKVVITLQPGNLVFEITNSQGSFVAPAGTYEATAVVICLGKSIPADSAVALIVPAGLGEVSVTFVFSGVHATLTVVVADGVHVTGPGINCPSDCTETYFTGTSVQLTANNPAAVFTGGCNGTGSCTVLMNQDKTVIVSLTVTPPVQNGFIQVFNDCCLNPDVFIDGVLVAEDLDVESPPVTRQVTAGDHVVRGDCGNSDDIHNVNVSPGETEVVGINCD